MAENLTITHLKTFLMVAQLGSFRQTAEQMQTTQPAISSRIAKLEDILQTKLLDRSTGHISLTKTGQALRPHAESMVKMADRLGEYIRDNNAVTGRISLGVTEFAVHTWLPAFLENVKIVFPELTLDLQVDTSHVLKKRLLRGDLDIVFILGPVGDERIQGFKIATHDYGWYASPNAGLLKYNFYSIPELADQYSLIMDTANSLVHREVRAYLQAADIYEPNIVSCFSSASAIQIATLGNGIAALPKRLARPAVDAGLIIPLMTDWSPSAMHFSGCVLATSCEEQHVRLIHFVKSLL